MCSQGRVSNRRRTNSNLTRLSPGAAPPPGSQGHCARLEISCHLPLLPTSIRKAWHLTSWSPPTYVLLLVVSLPHPDWALI